MADRATLTSISGLRVGHAQDLDAATGCTVVICPERTTCAVEQRGGAPGTRETDLLRPGRLVRHVDAVLLAGGSAYGLAAADGVVRYLEERGRGFAVGGGVVPIVPAAILYDLGVGRADVRPGPEMGYAACEAAGGGEVAQGSVGAGTGCRVGGFRDNDHATKGGIGSAARTLNGGFAVAALFAVNALGDIVGESGEVLAGLRERPFGPFADSLRWLLERPPASPLEGPGRESTVIGVVATNARLDRDELSLVASMAHDGVARSVRPSHTLYDGDTLFALSTGEVRRNPSLVGALAAEVTAAAIRSAVLHATSLGGVEAAGSRLQSPEGGL